MEEVLIVGQAILSVITVISVATTIALIFVLYGRRTKYEYPGGSDILNPWWLVFPRYPEELPDNEENRRSVRTARITHLIAWASGIALYLTYRGLQ